MPPPCGLLRPVFEIERTDSRRRPAAQEDDGHRSDLDAELADEGAVDGDILVLAVDPVIEMHLHLASRHLKHHVIFPVQRVAGNALNWEYDVVLEMSGSEVKVHFDDWIYRQDEDVAINRAFISKFGIEIGSVTIVFLRGRTAAAVGPLDLENWPQ